MDFHFASAWEIISDAIPDRTAMICDSKRRTWREFDDRGARVASLLRDHGLGIASKVGLYLHNSNEYQEAQFGVFKIRGCPVNVNYRYRADELVYLLDNADAEAVVFQGTYAARIWEIRKRLPKVKLWIQVNDGTESLIEQAVDFESSMLRYGPDARIPRDPDDVYMLYTGGTTGMPKGVMYPGGTFCQFLVAMGAQSQGMEPPASLAELGEFVRNVPAPPVTLPACPLMHGTGMWLGGFLPMMLGGTVVTTSRLGLDAHVMWGMVEEQSVTDLVIVGDAFAKPLLAALDEAKAQGRPYNLSTLKQMTSSGVMWSQETKSALLAHHDMVLADVMGSSEGSMGSSVTTRESQATTASFALNEGVKVFTDDGEEVQPGSGQIGRLATSGFVPLGYYKDEEKSQATFKAVNGVRYSFPGDYARIEADGSITLLGRGSVCINTAGEKVFPEEVEEVIKRHPQVFDCLVVGIPDERFGERIVAVASARDGEEPEVDEVMSFSRDHMAGYKAPRHVLLVPEVRRAPNGKADYKWAKAQALAAFT